MGPVRAAGTTLLLLAACAGNSSVSLLAPTTPSHGRSDLCPDGPVDPYANGLQSSTARRCSFDDAIGEGPTRLGGRVTGEVEGGLLGPGLADMYVSVHQVEHAGKTPGSGKVMARTVTDAQGTFHLSAVLPPSTYDVVVRAGEGGAPLAHQRLELEGDRPRRLEDLRLVVARDRALDPVQ